MPCAHFLHSLFTSRVSRSSNSRDTGSISSQNDPLLLTGGSLNNANSSSYHLTSNQHVATSIQSLVLYAIERNDIQQLTDLCAEFTLPYILQIHDYHNGETLLMKAARLYKEDALLFLLEMGSNIFEEDLRHEIGTVIHLSCSLGHGMEVLHRVRDFLLMEYDDDGRGMVTRMVNVKLSKDGRTPLHFAIEYDRMDIFMWLLKMGAEIGRGDHDTGTTDSFAQSENSSSTSTSKWSLSRLKNVATFPTDATADKKSPSAAPSSLDALIYAAKFSRLRMMQILIQRGANVECKDRIGNTPLLIAAEQGSMEMVRFLLEETNANLNHKAPCNMFSALHYAASENHYHLCKYLVESGLNVDERDTVLRTPLHTACVAGHAQTAYVLVRFCGADPYLEDDTDTYESSMDENTPLKSTPGGKSAFDLAYECGANAMRVAEALQKAQRELAQLSPIKKRPIGSGHEVFVSSPLAKSASRELDEHSSLSSSSLRTSTHSYGSTANQ